MARGPRRPHRSSRRIRTSRRARCALYPRGLSPARAVTRSPHVFGRKTAGVLNNWAGGLIEKRIATFDARHRRVHKRGLDGEALHDLRTAARRLRGALEDIGPLVPYSRRNLRLVKRVGDATGEARDLAVLIGRLQTYRALAGKAERTEIDGLITTLEHRERRALKHAKRALKDCVNPKPPPADGANEGPA